MNVLDRAASPATRPSPVVMDQVPAGENVDQATARTVDMMARYIRESIHDPLIQRAAADALRRFCPNKNSSRVTNLAKCWAVFWWIKHCVTFRSDEDALLYMGMMGEQDMLTSPSVLLRMRKPKEDCDGFTMLACAMLACLGVPVYPVAVAVDLNDPSRWSHVFAIARTEDGYTPVDASHGAWPGWMVPKERINRWQAFDLNGRPVAIPQLRPQLRPQQQTRFRGLHGYVASASNRNTRAPLPVFLPQKKRRKGIGDVDPETGLEYSSGFDYGQQPDYSETGGGLPGWSAGASSGSMLNPNIGVTQDANGNWLNAAGQPTNFGSGLPTGNLVPLNQIIPPGNWAGSSSAPSWLNSLVSAVSRVTSPVTPVYASSTGLFGSSSSTSMMLLVGAGILAVVLIAKKGK